MLFRSNGHAKNGAPPSFIFLPLVSFLVRPKPRISFLGLYLLRNSTETLATQAKSALSLCFCSGMIQKWPIWTEAGLWFIKMMLMVNSLLVIDFAPPPRLLQLIVQVHTFLLWKVSDRGTQLNYFVFYLQVINVNDPQSAQPISDSYLVEISLMTTVQQVNISSQIFLLSADISKNYEWQHKIKVF